MLSEYRKNKIKTDKEYKLYKIVFFSIIIISAFL